MFNRNKIEIDREFEDLMQFNGKSQRESGGNRRTEGSAIKLDVNTNSDDYSMFPYSQGKVQYF